MALGAPPINKQPTGLLGFLGIKNGGRYPEQLISALSPTWDTMRHYCAVNGEELRFSTAGTAGATAAGTTLAITAITPAFTITGGFINVPTNEWWYVEYAEITWALPAEAAATGDFSFQADLASALSTVPGLLAGWQAGIATQVRAGRRTATDGFWIGPGARVGIVSNGNNSVANTGVSGAMRIARFPG